VARPRRRRIAVIVVAVAAVLVVGGVLLALSLRSAASEVQANASEAQSSLERAKTQLAAGDVDAARTSARQAQEQVAAAALAADAPAVALVGRLPVAGDAVADLDRLVSAAGDLASASARLVDVYAAASGAGDGSGSALFVDGRADFAAMSTAASSVAQATDLAERAEQSLDAVQGTVPGTGALVAARDDALEQVRPLVVQLRALETLLRRLPDALGKGSTKNYLLVTMNPAELFPGGGAALSAAVLRFTDGRLSLPVRGSVSSQLFPGNPRVAWDHVSGAPYFPLPRQRAAFAWSNIHPDFARTSVEMRRAWVANGRAPVDGIIVLDPVALRAALKVTGPVRSSAYGTITAGNLLEKLLVAAYRDYRSDPDARHRVNDALISSFVGRLSSGEGMLQLARALAATAPGGHFRVGVDDPVLQELIASTDLGGVMPSAPDGDGLAVFTQNQNGSKVDIFQRRAVEHEVTVAEDGSARATTTVTVTYETPKDGRKTGDRVGYLTPWSSNWYMVYLPRAATDVRVDSPSQDPEDLDDATRYQDGEAWSIVRARRWTAAGGTTRMTVSYALPAGTFLRDGGLRYSLDVVPQAVLQDPTLTLAVRGPGAAEVVSDLPGRWSIDAGSAAWSGPLRQTSTTEVAWR
jgi:hypothetical protein